MWSDDYLKNLPPTVKGFKSNCNLKKVRCIVLIRELDNVPRMGWPLGLINELFPGRDGIVRCVSVQTAKGVFCRPVQKLHLARDLLLLIISTFSRHKKRGE